MPKDIYNLDASESAFFARELEHVKTKSYDVKYAPRKYAEFLPVSFEADESAEEITYRSFEGFGMAKIISDYSEDLPLSDDLGTETTVKVKSIGSAFQYSIQELRRSQRENRRLDSRRAQRARQAIDQKLNKIAWTGDSDYNIQGFINYPGITEYTVPNGAGGNSEWSTKTPDEIQADLSGIVSGVVTSTNEVETPDVMLLPIAQYELIANMRVTDGNDKTVLTFFLENNPHINTIGTVPELSGSGADGSDRYMVYKRDDMHVTFELPLRTEQFAPQQKNLAFKVPLHARTGGVIVYYPLSVSFGDGI